MAAALKGKLHTWAVMKFAFPGQKKAEIEEDVTKAAMPCGKAPPESAKPPPQPPSTFGSDRREAEVEHRGKDSMQKGQKKGKSGAWQPKGGKPLAQVEEDYDRRSQYTTQTAREREWGLLKRQEEWEHERYQAPNNWELSSGAWRWKPQKGKGGACKKTLGFGEYSDRIYGGGLTPKPIYAKCLEEDPYGY